MINFLKWLFCGKPLAQIDYLAQLNQITRPKSDESQNAAPLYIEAIKAIGKIPKQTQDLLVYKEFSQIDDEDNKILKDFLDANTYALYLAKEGSKKPFYWEEYKSCNQTTELFSVLMPSLMPMKNISIMLCWRSQFYAQEEEDNAFDDIQAAYRIGQHLREKSGIIEQLTGISMKSISLKALRTIIYTYPVDHRRITQWKAHFAKLIENEDFDVSYEGSKLGMYNELQRSFTSGPQGHIYIKRHQMRFNIPPVVPTSQMPRLFHLFFRHPDKQETSQALDRLWSLCEQLKDYTPYQLSKNRQQFDQQMLEITDKNYFIQFFAPSLERIHLISYHLRTEIAAMNSIFAILEYRNQNAQYPDSLTQLVDAGLLDELPADPFSDGPLIYRKTDDSFILYSAGENLIDDGGKVGIDTGGQPAVWGKDGDAIFWPPVSSQKQNQGDAANEKD